MKMDGLDRFETLEVDPQRARDRSSSWCFQARLSTWSGRSYWNLELLSRLGGEHA